MNNSSPSQPVDTRRRHGRGILYLSAISSGALLTGTTFRWELMNTLAFLYDLLYLLAVPAFAVSVILSLVHAVRHLRQGLAVACVPLALNVTVLVVMIEVPIKTFRINYNFRHNLAQRMWIIEQIRTGALKAERDTPPGMMAWVDLPAGFRGVAMGGQAKLFTPESQNASTQIEFPLYAGCMGDCGAGFVYVAGAQPPNKFPDASAQDVRKLAEHWYWVEVY